MRIYLHSGLLLLVATVLAQSQDFTYTTNGDAITITHYTGPGGSVTIPETFVDGGVKTEKNRRFEIPTEDRCQK